MESRVGRGPSHFYTLIGPHDQRLAYVWERSLHTDMPRVPDRQRLEFYELWSAVLWDAMFCDCKTVAERVTRFQEYVYDGDITLRKHTRVSPMHKINVFLYDGEQIVIDTPPPTAELIDFGNLGWQFPKSLAWSKLRVQEHYRLATTWKKELVT